MSGRKVITVFIILCSIFILSGAAFFFLLPRQEAITSPLPDEKVEKEEIPPTPTVSNTENVAIMRTVEQFYASYAACLKDPPRDALGRVGKYCQEHNPYITTAFTKNLLEFGTARRGADPVTCAQNPPSSVAAGAIDFEAQDRAIATVTAVFGSSLAQKIPVVVVKEKDKWGVDSVLCQ
jgi:hypothetical protein